MYLNPPENFGSPEAIEARPQYWQGGIWTPGTCEELVVSASAPIPQTPERLAIYAALADHPLAEIASQGWQNFPPIIPDIDKIAA